MFKNRLNTPVENYNHTNFRVPGTTKSAWVAKEVVVADRGLDYLLHNNIGVGLVS